MRADITAEFFESELGLSKTKSIELYEKIKNNGSHMVRALLTMKKDTFIKKLQFFKDELGYSFEATLDHPGLLTMDCFESENTPNSLKAKIKYFKKELGFTNENFQQISIAIFSNDLEVNKSKIDFLQKRINFGVKHIQNVPTLLGISLESLEQKIKFFEDNLEFTPKQFSLAPKLLTFDIDSDSPQSIKNKIKFFEDELAFEPSHFKLCPHNLTLDTISGEENPTSVKAKIKFFRQTLGFENKHFQFAPYILGYDIVSGEENPSSVKSKINYFRQTLGFENKHFQMTPSLLASDISPNSPTSVPSKVKFFAKEVGFSAKHFREFPTLLKYDCTSDESEPKSIKSKLAKLHEVGITNEDIQENPNLLAIPAEDIKDKYVLWSVMFPDRSFMKKHNWSITKPEKIYARFMFLQERNQLSFYNVSTSENKFFKQFKIHSETLMNKYPLNDMAYQQIYALYYLLALEPPIERTQTQKEQ